MKPILSRGMKSPVREGRLASFESNPQGASQICPACAVRGLHWNALEWMKDDKP